MFCYFLSRYAKFRSYLVRFNRIIINNNYCYLGSINWCEAAKQRSSEAAKQRSTKKSNYIIKSKLDSSIFFSCFPAKINLFVIIFFKKFISFILVVLPFILAIKALYCCFHSDI